MPYYNYFSIKRQNPIIKESTNSKIDGRDSVKRKAENNIESPPVRRKLFS